MPRDVGELISPRDDGPEPATVWGRLSQTFLKPAPPKAAPSDPGYPNFARMTDEEKQNRIRRVDPTERKLGIAASIIAVVLAMVSYIPYMVSKRSVALTTVKPKNGKCHAAAGIMHIHYVASTKTCDGIYSASHYVLPLVVVLVLAAAIYVTVLIGRRSALAFTLVMTGLAFGTFIYLLPYAVAGGWVMLRAWRTQKYGAPTSKTVLTGWVPPPARGTARRPANTSPRGRRGKGAEAKPTVRKPPSANKRYTPKSPPKKKVAPPS